LVVKILIFKIAEQRFAISIAKVVETVRAVAVTPLPEGLPAIEGVINYRGRLAVVLDLRALFGLPATSLSTHHHFVIARTGERLLALHVDRAEQVLEVGDLPLEKADQELPRAPLIAGVAKLPDGLVLIPDLAKILAAAEEARFGEADAGAPLVSASAL
jgi:purine-binding chemotaxis protein CheW